ncbi:MAG: nickel pincer cofactor biosynthesis protein LarC [Actinomycetota bacterium]
MTTLYFECFSGASGDMIMGALLDAGASEQRVRSSLDALQLDGWELHVSTVSRAGIRATRAEIAITETVAPCRRHRDVVAIIKGSPLPETIARRALRTFELLADAEARVHSTSREEVHFHEVGAVDAIVDVVGCCAAFEHFRPHHVVTSAIATGAGITAGAHGSLPLPAPAVTEILQRRKASIFGRGKAELITPTGAALLGAFSDEFGRLPAMKLHASGYGAGARELDTPNVLRVFVGERDENGRRAQATVIEANLDDMNPELVPHVIGELMSAGAQDAWVTPIVMKKGRPGLTLSVLASPAERTKLTEIIHRETTTLGVRVVPVIKDALERRWIEVDVAGRPVRVKIGMQRGEAVNVGPEYDDARAAARASGLPLKQVYALAVKAAEASIASDAI